MQKKILNTVMLVVTISVVFMSMVQYISEYFLAKQEIITNSKTNLDLISPLGRKGINGANLMILKDETSKELFQANPDLIFLKMSGMSEGSPANAFSDAIPPQEMEYEYLAESAEGGSVDFSLLESLDLGEHLFEGGRLYMKVDLGIPNGGKMLGVFSAAKLSDIWTRGLLKLIPILGLVLLFSFVVGRTRASVLEKEFINREDLSKTSSELRDAAKKIGDFSSTISESASELSSSSQRQSEAVTEMDAFIKEVDSRFYQNLSQGQEAFRLAEEMETASLAGARSVKDIETAIGSMAEAIDKLGGIVGLIETISEKTKLIDDITFQTKLLSFNASVEAARAGEGGKGFSVVAEEMSALSTHTAAASKEINEIVERTKTDSKEKIAQSKSLADDSIKLSEAASQELVKIEDSAKKVTENIGRILESSESQSMDISNINKAMDQIRSLTEHNGDQVISNTKLGTELKEHSGTVNGLVNDLYSLLERASDKRADKPEKARFKKFRNLKKEKLDAA